MPGDNKKVTDTKTNLLLKAAGLFKYARPFCEVCLSMCDLFVSTRH